MNMIIIINKINVFILPVKKNKRYREWSIQIMKIAQIIYNYHGIKPDKTLDIYIFKLLSCI